jgi:hypothetical protein
MGTIDHLRQRFDDEGYLAPIDVLDAAELQHYRSCFEELEAREGRDACVSGIQSWHFDTRFIWEVATHPRLLDAMRCLAGDDLLLGDTRFFVKYCNADGGRFFPWHQDAPFWGIDPPVAFTCSVAFDDTTPEAGCLRVIPGSHRSGIVPHRRSNRLEGNMLRRGQEVPAELVDESAAVDVALRAGQMSVHHSCVFHASGLNTSSARRCCLAIVFLQPAIRHSREYVVPGEFTDFLWRRRRVVVVSGRDEYDHFDRVEAPFPVGVAVGGGADESA